VLRRLLVPLLLLVPAAAIANPSRITTYDPPVEGVAYDQYRERWRGGSNSLPYGLGDAASVLDHARDMTCVTHAMDEMSARGFLRRPLWDIGLTRDGYSCAVISFEKPGFDPVAQGSQQPAVLVITKSYEVSDVGYRPTTQVLGCTLRDSCGTFTFASDACDSVFAVVGVPSVGSLDALETGTEAGAAVGSGWSRDDESFIYRYSAYDPADNGTWNTYISPGMRYLYEQEARAVMLGAKLGAIGGVANALTSGKMTWATLALNVSVCMLYGVLCADATFWLNPPDTSRVGR